MARARIKDAKALADVLRKNVPTDSLTHTPFRPNPLANAETVGHFYTAAMAVRGEIGTTDRPLDADLLQETHNKGNNRLRAAIQKAAEQERFK